MTYLSLALVRDHRDIDQPTPHGTRGELFAYDPHGDMHKLCDTLEPITRTDGKKPRAIPAGLYDVQISHSEHFERDLPHLTRVKGFTGILIHAGNTVNDTRGCILVGLKDDSELWRLKQSRSTLVELMELMAKHDRIVLTIRTNPQVYQQPKVDNSSLNAELAITNELPAGV